MFLKDLAAALNAGGVEAKCEAGDQLLVNGCVFVCDERGYAVRFLGSRFKGPEFDMTRAIGLLFKALPEKMAGNRRAERALKLAVELREALPGAKTKGAELLTWIEAGPGACVASSGEGVEVRLLFGSVEEALGWRDDYLAAKASEATTSQ